MGLIVTLKVNIASCNQKSIKFSKKVCNERMRISYDLVDGEAGDVDRPHQLQHAGVVGQRRVIGLERAPERRHDHVLDGEADRGVNRVDLPGRAVGLLESAHGVKAPVDRGELSSSSPADHPGEISRRRRCWAPASGR